jgi:hypothetical protein
MTKSFRRGFSSFEHSDFFRHSTFSSHFFGEPEASGWFPKLSLSAGRSKSAPILNVKRSQRGGNVVAEASNAFFQASAEQRNDGAPTN